MPLGVDQQFAGYTVVRRLGAGGMGEVYLAQHPRLPRRDALKLLTADVSVDPSFRERFLQEADLASTLWHPHIVGVHDRGECDGQLWISMDYVEGEDASGVLAGSYPDGMPPDMVATIVTGVASALDYAHSQGLLHRDVKPANILIGDAADPRHRRILLTDFGIARAVGEASGLTATNMTIGTVDYTAPEQLLGEELDGRADQYALAVTAYQLLCGRPPFRDTNAAVVIGRHLNAAPPPLSKTRPQLAALDPVFARALAKKPADRYPNCGAFAAALADAIAAPGEAPVAPEAPATTVLPRPSDEEPPVLVAQIPAAAAPEPSVVDRLTHPPSSPGPAAPPNWQPPPGAYFDGRQWQTAAPASGSGNRTPVLLAVAVVALLAIAGIVVLIVSLGGSSQDTADRTAAAPTSSYRSPTYAAPPAYTAPATTAAPAVGLTGRIVGTCDEGGTCGLKQRNAPYTAAGRLVPGDLQDGNVVTVSCSVSGDLRSNEGHGSSSVWYRLANGAYVPSVYLDGVGSVPSC
ncbi:hypothetical protein MINS_18690 [Mycolicibacterium insubricum]|uniref:serine/threonine-protein kinase n=2 Tax=Mycolicibacterium insubricum TaxID=444597 RepID=UPI0009F521FC|nr:serine/threonine-protein kinase [Mycolicibacterium insubricum]BBZ66440.1 hypothetical protein MINS_18690 [Mycolicibacterium insubricum]